MLKNTTQTAVPAFVAHGSRAVQPYAGLTVTQAMSAPKSAAQGTAVSFAGRVRLIDGLDVTAANPGSPPREAPV